MFCDNTAVVSEHSSGKVRNQLLASILNEIWFVVVVGKVNEVDLPHLVIPLTIEPTAKIML